MSSTSRPTLAFFPEWKALLKLAIPIFIAQLANTAMGFVDTVMAGRVSPVDLAAVALGNSIWVPVYLLMNGILLTTTAQVSRHFGGGTEHKIGMLVRQALWLGLFLGCLCGVLLWNATPILVWREVDPELISLSMGYLRAVACGFPAVAIYLVLRCYSEGLGRTRPSMVIALLGLAVNIPLNYILINGKFGLPALGGVGCGVATGIVMAFMMLAQIVWVRWAPYYKRSKLIGRFDWPNKKRIKGLLFSGIPIGIAIFAEASIFSIIALLIGNLGAHTVAGHQTALNFSAITFMLPYSLAMAATVRVGQALGANSSAGARFSAKVALITAFSLSIGSASLMYCGRFMIAGIYTQDAQVLAIAASLIIYAAIYQIPDAIQVTAAGALRGYQDNKVTMIFTLFAYWGIGLPIGYILGLTDYWGPAQGPAGLWQGLIIGLTCSGLLLGSRLYRVAQRPHTTIYTPPTLS